MTQPVWQLATNNLAGRRGRTTLLVLAVALATTLSVAISGAVHVFGQSITKQAGRVAGLADVRLVNTFGQRLDEALLARVRNWPEVRLATARFNSGGTILLPRNQKKTTLSMHGVESPAEFELHPLTLLEGRLFEAPNEVIIGQRMRDLLEAKVGDELHVLTSDDAEAATIDELHTLTIVGVFERPPLGVFQRPLMKMSLDRVRRLEDPTGQLAGKIDLIEAQLLDGVLIDEFQTAHASELPEGVSFQTTAARSARLDRGRRGAQLVINLITMLVFLCTAFIILTSLTTAVTQRMRELAVLRCLGASRMQIAAAQLLSGAMICAMGAAIGVVLGVGIAYGLYRYFADELRSEFVLNYHGIATAVGAAVSAGLLGALYPGIMAARVRPLAALAVHAKLPSRLGVLACAVIGFLLITIPPTFPGLRMPVEDSFWLYMNFGVPMTFVGYFLLSVPVLWLAARVIAPALAHALHLPPALLRQSLAATPYRYGFTGGALMIGMAMLLTIWTDGRSIMHGWFDRIKMPDGFVASFSPFGMGPTQIRRLAEIDAITDICPTRSFPVQTASVAFGVEGLTTPHTQFVASDIEVFLNMTDLQWIEGDPVTALKRMKQGRAVLVSREFLVAHGVGVGDTLTLLSASKKPVPFEVVGVVFSPGLDVAVHYFGISAHYGETSISSVFGTWEDAKQYFAVEGANLVLLGLRADVSDADAIKQITSHVPAVIAGSSREIRRGIEQRVTAMLSVASGIAVAALVIACFGVGNLIIANITARRFEYGVLRAIGSQPSLLGRLIASEAAIVALVGCIVGTVLGMQLSLVGAMWRNRIFGLGYTPTMQWDVIAWGSLAVISSALLAAALPIWRLLHTHPRALLALNRAG